MRKKTNREKAGALQATHQPAPLSSILVVIALPEENAYVHSVLRDRKGWEVPDTVRRRYRCHFESPYGRVRVVIQTLERMGNIEATLGTTAAMSSADPDMVMLVGLAGSLDPDLVQLGDVVISNQAKMYVSDKVGDINAKKNGKRRFRFNDETAEAGDQIVVDRRDSIMGSSYLRYERRFVESTGTDEILSNAEISLKKQLALLQRPEMDVVPKAYHHSYTARSTANIHSGWLLASSQVVDSAEFRDYLVAKNEDYGLDIHRQTQEIGRCDYTPQKTKLLAVDMESYGVLRAVETLRSPRSADGGFDDLLGGIVVRGISDLCEEKANTDETSGSDTRRIAVKNAAEVAFRIIEEMDYSEMTAR